MKSIPTHYSPFGTVLYGRSWSSESYRYGYQGSEKSNEAYYSTYYRDLDTRCSRWISIDPKYNRTPWNSPYSAMGSNPISYNDVLGDYFDKESQKVIDIHKTGTQKKIEATEKIKTNLEAEIKERTDKGKEATKNQTKRLDELKTSLNEYADALTEIGKLESSTQLYSLNKLPLNYSYSTGIGGIASYDPTTKAVVADYVDESTLAHELKHLYQFETGDISFDPLSGGPGYLYDANDEIEAYRRQSAYDGNTRLSNLTADSVRKRHIFYSKLKDGPLNINSTIEDVFRGLSPQANELLDGMDEDERQLPYKGVVIADEIYKK